MRKFLTAVVLIPLGLVFVVFAVAIVGVAAGGIATWFRQRRWRRAARQHEADARAVRAQLADLRSSATASRYEPQRLAGPPQGGFQGQSGRDKQGATL